VLGKKNLNQRDEMKNYTHGRGVQCDAAEKLAGAGEREESIRQPNKIASQREA
jgi:hypothetical protein